MRDVIRDADRVRDGRWARNRRREKRVRELAARVGRLESELRCASCRYTRFL